ILHQPYGTSGSDKNNQKTIQIPADVSTVNDQEIQKIALELEKTKKQLQSYHGNSDLNSELIKKFIEVNKKIIRDKNDEEAGNEIKRIDKKLLKDKILSKKAIEEITRHCERLVDLEWQIEQLKVQGE